MIPGYDMIGELTHSNFLVLALNAFSVPHCILGKLIALFVFKVPKDIKDLEQQRKDSRAQTRRAWRELHPQALGVSARSDGEGYKGRVYF